MLHIFAGIGFIVGAVGFLRTIFVATQDNNDVPGVCLMLSGFASMAVLFICLIGV